MCIYMYIYICIFIHMYVDPYLEFLSQLGCFFLTLRKHVLDICGTTHKNMSKNTHTCVKSNACQRRRTKTQQTQTKKVIRVKREVQMRRIDLQMRRIGPSHPRKYSS